MNRLNFLLVTFLIATILSSCTKDDSLFSTQNISENRSSHQGHSHIGQQDLAQRIIGGVEEHDPIVKFIDHDIYSIIGTILPDNFSSD